MNKNPIVPFLLIFALGIGLIFFMSLYGLEQQEAISKDANGDGDTEETTEVANFDPEEVAQGKCISCHGGDLEGGMGGAAPALAGTSLSQDELIDAIKNGIPPSMPGGLVDDAHLEEMADYLLSLE